eukprot:scaffold122122_cov33-Tisochrysis_lutea.AAC.4
MASRAAATSTSACSPRGTEAFGGPSAPHGMHGAAALTAPPAWEGGVAKGPRSGGGGACVFYCFQAYRG